MAAQTQATEVLGFLRLRAWDARREAEMKKPRHAFIDEVWRSVKSSKTSPS